MSFLILRAIYEQSVTLFTHFFLGLAIFFLLIYRYSLYIEEVCPIAVIHVTCISIISHCSFDYVSDDMIMFSMQRV